MDWTEVTIHTTTEAADLMAEILRQSGAGGAVIEDKADIENMQRSQGDWDFIDEAVFSAMPFDVLVKGYLPNNEKLIDSISLIRSSIAGCLENRADGFDLGTCRIDIGAVKEEDWANNWKQYYKPFRPGKTIVIKPSWEDYTPQDGEIILHMDPGMAFGTGTHETTSLCVQLLEQYVTHGCTVLDIGCGTGVLGISAALIGASSVYAADIDLNSVAVAKDNVERNRLTDKVVVRQADLLTGAQSGADIIVANIIADVIIKMVSSVKEHLKYDGIFIASGIINERAEDVISALAENGFVVEHRLIKGEWTAMAARKRK